MGEYAKFNGKEIKIGTCESMYYLRADQAQLVKPMKGSLDPVRACKSIRFRFPFPEEDGIDPGEFENYNKTVGLYGLPVSEDFKHYTVQFHCDRGYFTSLPCPETKEGQKLGFARNGNPSPVRIVQQKVFNGMLITILECGGCGIAWRLETLEDAAPVIKALQTEAEDLLRRRSHDSDGARYREIAKRIMDGYINPPQWVKDTKI